MTEILPRNVCSSCGRPAVVCYCRFVTRIETQTRVVIFQHPRERKVPINTARIASLCLPNSELHVGTHWEELAALANPEQPAALLYPGEGAIDIEAHPPKGPITLAVVDGTWWQAKKLVKLNPLLAKLPRYAFQPQSPSNYRIRREPKEDYVSTIEALVHVLGVLEKAPEKFLPMLVPFRAMVDSQLSYIGKSSVPRHAKKKPRMPTSPWSRVSPIVRERANDIVCVHAEANAWPYNSYERSTYPDELVQWVAYRPSTGEALDAILAPRNAVCASTARHSGIDPQALSAGMTTDALLELWSRFSKPTDVVCAWGTYPFTLFARAGGVLPEARIDLRRVARTFAVRTVGTIQEFRAKVGMPQPEARVTGRAGTRLAEVVAVTQFLGNSSSNLAAQAR